MPRSHKIVCHVTNRPFFLYVLHRTYLRYMALGGATAEAAAARINGARADAALNLNGWSGEDRWVAWACA
jgi:hypothetical protein